MQEAINVDYEVNTPDANLIWWVVVNEGKKIVGLMKMIPGEKYTMHIMQTWVHPNHRGQGYYRDMFETAINFARSYGFKTIEGATNKKTVQRMMEKMGRKLHLAVYRYKV